MKGWPGRHPQTVIASCLTDAKEMLLALPPRPPIRSQANSALDAEAETSQRVPILGGIALGPVLVPLSTIGWGHLVVLLDVGTELADALAFPPWTGTVVKFAGLCTLLIGVMAWLTGMSIHRRAWGRRIAVSGFALTIVGLAFDTFVEVLKYVLTG